MKLLCLKVRLISPSEKLHSKRFSSEYWEGCVPLLVVSSPQSPLSTLHPPIPSLFSTEEKVVVVMVMVVVVVGGVIQKINIRPAGFSGSSIFTHSFSTLAARLWAVLLDGCGPSEQSRDVWNRNSELNGTIPNFYRLQSGAICFT